MHLYRPTGIAELRLLCESGWRAWPPRLRDQPIFYPVTTFEYAEKIARDWNSTRSKPDNFGFVTMVEVSDAISAKYPIKDAGGRSHQELWVPSLELEEFNASIIGEIEVVAIYRDGEHQPDAKLDEVAPW